MTYAEVFGEIVSIMQNDSATCKDYGAGDFAQYQSQISDDMDRMEFLHLVQDYLATFKVYGHLHLSDQTLGSLGFSVMRYEDTLYVTEANSDTGLTAGDKIIAADSFPIANLAIREKNYLMGEAPERQGDMWCDILKFYKTVTVACNDGTEKTIALNHNSISESKEKYSYKKINDDTLYLKFLDFVDEAAISTIYAACKEDLDSCRNLIVDVRQNGGGADAAFFPLLEYGYPEGVSVAEYEKTKYPIEINYSEKNCNDRLALLKNFFGDDVPVEAKPMVDKMLSDLNENKGKGFVINADDLSEGIVGRKTPEKVFVITDERCASSGEAFVEAMAFSSKVEVVGRPTCGILDYSNCNMMSLGDFTFVYPTSRDTRIDHGLGMTGKGVPVDHYIHWTPDSIGKDLEMEYVMSRIE